jgi:Domain of unknown function DUF29
MKASNMSKAGELYNRDFFLWTQEQAAALRRAKGSNLPLDWENLADEIESLGKSDRRELASQIRGILRHLFKLEASHALQAHAGWRSTIIDARSEIEAVLRDSPGLRRQVDRLGIEQLSAAAKLAAGDLGNHREPADAVWERLEKGGYTADQVLGDWFPEAHS